ncbi:response regulator [Gracilibacillus oryzae]|uniref:Response regulator n=1 Tax=Gracilibacillus oryzae TaxID=1672701 RepID=A0A7C8GSD7_9BACI|nr:response regulator [Gracilibacillus oryzae]KAB8131007.1 response regulator [Gracilibacillus oryzae]
MYRLLIVDDEEIITDGLYEVFHNYIPEQLDVCKAYSALEALAWMKRTRIDIVLTDIAMPGMNGLELIEQVQSYWPRCKVIFLTGHSKFEYTYQAIQMQNVRYLLKTEGYDKVMDTVNDVVHEIQQTNMDNLLLEQSREQIYVYQFLAQGEYFRHLLQKKQDVSVERVLIVNEFKKFNINLDPARGVLMVLGCLNYPSEKTYTEKSEILSSLRTKWNYYTHEKLNSIEIVDRYGDILWFIQPFKNSDDKLDQHFPKYLEGTLELIQKECLSSLNLSITFTLSGEFCKWDKIAENYERLRRTQHLKGSQSVPAILWVNQDLREEDPKLDQLIPSYKMETMSTHLEANRGKEFLNDLDELVNLELFNGSAHGMMETYYSVALVIYSHINRLGWYDRIKNSELLLRLDDHSSIHDAFQYLRQTAEEIVMIIREDERDRASQIIECICNYIEKNLGEDLSLVRLAEVHYFNPSYLSYFFKQEKGINLSEYIEKCRIRKAKELLRRRDLKIREVGNSVGYTSAHSFTRFFKKVSGLTPKEYRETIF